MAGFGRIDGSARDGVWGSRRGGSGVEEKGARVEESSGGIGAGLSGHLSYPLRSQKPFAGT